MFLPQSGSAFVFIVVMAGYSSLATALISAIVYLLHYGPSPPSVWELRGQPVWGAVNGVVFAPLFESCILVGMIELLRWLKSPRWLQVFGAAAVLAGPHSLRWAPHAFVCLPDFSLQAASYLYWRPNSRTKGFAVVSCLHAIHNLIPAIWMLGNATRRA
jgi:hypothetical protein